MPSITLNAVLPVCSKTFDILMYVNIYVVGHTVLHIASYASQLILINSRSFVHFNFFELKALHRPERIGVLRHTISHHRQQLMPVSVLSYHQPRKSSFHWRKVEDSYTHFTRLVMSGVNELKGFLLYVLNTCSLSDCPHSESQAVSQPSELHRLGV